MGLISRVSSRTYRNFIMFQNWKKNTLSKMEQGDRSRAGGVDKPIQKMVSAINQHPLMFTTSSCSGRSIVFSTDDKSEKGKGHCTWHYTTHDTVCLKSVIQAVDEKILDKQPFTIKFEPCILHIQVENLDLAREKLESARAVGYRNSGISMGVKNVNKKNKPTKISLAIRHTAGLEVPFPDKSMVNAEYLEFLVNVCNEKMEENIRNIEKLNTVFVEKSCENDENVEN